jgi:GH35 family endo-1,4-beta-xylanase
MIKKTVVFLFLFLVFFANVLRGAEISVEFNGLQVEFADQQPVVVNGRTLVPVRDVFEFLRFNVEWEAAVQTAVITNGADTIRITVGEEFFTLNGERHSLDVSAQIIGGRTMLPLRLPLESVGFNVNWDAARNAVVISSQPEPSQPEPSQPLRETREIVYSLAADTDLQNISAHTIFARIGSPTLASVHNQNAIAITNRTHNWEGLSIRIPAFQLVPGERYSLEITGRAVSPIPSGANMELMLGGGTGENSWAWLNIFAPIRTGAADFTLSFPSFTLENSFDGSPISSYRYFNVQTNPEGAGVDFTITGITVMPLPPLEPPLPAERLPSISEAFADYFLVGNIWGGWGSTHRILNQPGAAEHFLHQYNAVTAENHHKPILILPEIPNFNPDTWNFSHADLIVDWAEENGLYMVGHTLVWQQEANRLWLTNVIENGVITDRPLTRAEAIVNMEMYINAVAGRYSGRVAAWDVVNEAFSFSQLHPPWCRDRWRANPDWRRFLVHGSPNRRNYATWYDAFANGARGNECGSDFVYYAFRFARIADPHALLIYNDAWEWGAGRHQAIAQMTEEINTRWLADPLYDGRLLIEAIGMQGHFPMDVDLNEVRTAIQRFVQTGVRIHITEMDMRFGDFSEVRNNPLVRLTPAQLEQQAIMYRDLFSMFMEFSDHIDRVSFWGLADEHSWLAGGAPLLHTLDENGNFIPKPAFWAVLGLVGVTEQ